MKGNRKCMQLLQQPWVLGNSRREMGVSWGASLTHSLSGSLWHMYTHSNTSNYQRHCVHWGTHMNPHMQTHTWDPHTHTHTQKLQPQSSHIIITVPIQPQPKNSLIKPNTHTYSHIDKLKHTHTPQANTFTKTFTEPIFWRRLEVGCRLDSAVRNAVLLQGGSWGIRWHICPRHRQGGDPCINRPYPTASSATCYPVSDWRVKWKLPSRSSAKGQDPEWERLVAMGTASSSPSSSRLASSG